MRDFVGRVGRAPPRTRGWTPRPVHGQPGDRGSPAHAGMDPSRRSGGRCGRGLPRARGDGPLDAGAVTADKLAPPRTRGWTEGEPLLIGELHGSPAHAGMDRWASASSADTPGLPRARGDGPRGDRRSGLQPVAPPRTRGWTRRVEPPDDPRRGSPAHAGMDPGLLEVMADAWRLPRARGDGPEAVSPPRSAMTAPPRTRGWTVPFQRRHGRNCGSPAHAGMDPRPRRRSCAAPRLPRARGDGPSAVTSPISVFMAPPRTRGWTAHGTAAGQGVYGSPAHAGMDRWRSPGWFPVPWLPRARGDGPASRATPCSPAGAPPRTRGWTAHRAGQPPAGAGSPAHAGMDRPSPRPRPSSRWLPRARGDGPCCSSTPGRRSGAPPRTRGWTLP